MANTYTQLYIHVVCRVKRTGNPISKKWENELYKYITGIITSKKQKLMIINGVEDHIHILLGINPNCNLSDLIRDIKANSTRFINDKKYTPTKFEWQKGFAAFTVGYSQVPIVVSYIKYQEEHHKKKTFKEEYIQFLEENNIDYKSEYLIDETEATE